MSINFEKPFSTKLKDKEKSNIHGDYSDSEPVYQNENDFNIWGDSWEKRKQNYLDVLVSMGYEIEPKSFLYRIKGKDTLTKGSQGGWLEIESIIHDFEPPKSDLEAKSLLETLSELDEILTKAKIIMLKSKYDFRNEEKVDEFITKNNHLIEFLEESWHYLIKYFGLEQKYILEVFSDPEINEPHNELFVIIQTGLTPEEALNRLDKFDDEWYLDNIDKFDDLLNFNIEII